MASGQAALYKTRASSSFVKNANYFGEFPIFLLFYGSSLLGLLDIYSVEPKDPIVYVQ